MPSIKLKKSMFTFNIQHSNKVTNKICSSNDGTIGGSSNNGTRDVLIYIKFMTKIEITAKKKIGKGTK